MYDFTRFLRPRLRLLDPPSLIVRILLFAYSQVDERKRDYINDACKRRELEEIEIRDARAKIHRGGGDENYAKTDGRFPPNGIVRTCFVF